MNNISPPVKKKRIRKREKISPDKQFVDALREYLGLDPIPATHFRSEYYKKDIRA